MMCRMFSYHLKKPTVAQQAKRFPMYYTILNVPNNAYSSSPLDSVTSLKYPVLK